MLGGMHCSPRFGRTRDNVVADGFVLNEELDWVPAEGPLNPEKQAADAVSLVAAALKRQQPEALVLVGDRFETLSAALAATLARVPIVHLHGGEETEGAIDNSFRHAISKLSHLHFTSHPEHTERLISMGEDPATIHMVGAAGLDNLNRKDLPGREELEKHIGIQLSPPVVIVTLHPATLGAAPEAEVAAVTKAMDAIQATYIITLPNTDRGNDVIRDRMLSAAQRPRRIAVEALGDRRFWALMRVADAMLGNSSSAIIEAPALGLPAVNIGERQKGRVRGANVLDVAPEAHLVEAAFRRALTREFRAACQAAPSPFGDGRAGEAIVSVLRKWIPPRPPVKPKVQA